ncbi:alkaline phosphatase family protein [Propionicicella superfundia]|uniref:alkaline phosphatase family protein n=1 Tax=Propionicicella superfundia TaxID=348582 RepID=UPI00041E69B2|nr:nucleotide pyrophosphatase/phosphodiesterase family protein [Propionicicella superfundia]
MTVLTGGGAPVLPAYGSGTLSDLLPSVRHHLIGRSGDRLGVPAAQRYVVLLVDGLGDVLLSANETSAPFLAAHRTRRLTSGVPSTTVTSVTSLGTGLVPGQHGMVGYSFREPGGRILNALMWDVDVNPFDLQPQATELERLASAGVTVANVSPSRFDRSGLTNVALRGGSFLGVPDESDEDLRIALAVQAATAGARTLVYCYERHLDHTGHGLGCASAEWREQLLRIDGFAERLRDALPDDVVLLVTGDHGMVDVPRGRFLTVEDEPDLMRDVALFGGEGRLRQLYVRDGAAAAVRDRWAERLGVEAWVRTRDEARQEGWFGEVGERNAPRIGDVLVAMAGDGAVMTRTLSHEYGLVGMHGSLTEAEMTVPLIAV